MLVLIFHFSHLWILTVSLQADATAQYQPLVHLDDVIHTNHWAFDTSWLSTQTGLHLLQPFTYRQSIIKWRRSQTGAQT